MPLKIYALIKKMMALLGEKKNIKLTFIPSCHYHAIEDYEDIISQYRAVGVSQFIKISPDETFSKALLRTALSSDIIHLGGGNTFYFLKHLRSSGMLREIRAWAKDGGILTGLSAGAIMMTKQISTAGFPSFDHDENDDNLSNLKSLSLVDFEFFPHYKNSKRYDNELSAYSKLIDTPLYACSDGNGLIIEHDELRFVGPTACFINGHKFFINK